MSFFGSNYFESNHFASNHLAGVTVDLGGGGVSKRKRKKGEGYAREREILERSLESQFVKTEEKKPKRKEVADGSELLAEVQEIERQLKMLEMQFLTGEITKLELEIEKSKKNQALEVIFMALDLDKKLVCEIIFQS